MAPQDSKKGGSHPHDHHHISSRTNTGIDSEQILGTTSVLTISSLAPQTSARVENRFLSGLKFLVQHLYPGHPRNEGVAHGPLSALDSHGT
jgi:hypothetical protein